MNGYKANDDRAESAEEIGKSIKIADAVLFLLPRKSIFRKLASHRDKGRGKISEPFGFTE